MEKQKKKEPVLLDSEVLGLVRDHKKKTGVEIKFFIEQAVKEKLRRIRK